MRRCTCGKCAYYITYNVWYTVIDAPNLEYMYPKHILTTITIMVKKIDTKT